MKVNDIVIQIPINIRFDADGNIQATTTPVDDNENLTSGKNSMVFPLDQELELKKAALGKTSKVIKGLLKAEDE
jgi:hypothetical protein